MRLQTFFNAHPVFRFDEFASFMREQGIERAETWRQQLSYHHKVGNLVHIRKSLYAVKSATVSTDEFYIDPYSIAGKASEDSVIGYHTALELHQIAYTSFQELTYLSKYSGKTFSYKSHLFRSVSIPKALVGQNQQENYLDLIMHEGIIIKVTNLERTIVDILARPELSGGWEEIWRSLDRIVQIDAGKIIEYALLLNNSTTIAKLGFYLEQLPAYLKIDHRYIAKLLPYIPKSPHYMERNRKKKCRYIEKWQLVVPLEIINREWEEPDAEDV